MSLNKNNLLRNILIFLSTKRFSLFHVYKTFFYNVKQFPNDIVEYLRNNQINFLFQDVHT